MGKPCDRGVHVVPMGFANGSLIEGDDGLTLIDVGFPESVITIAWNAQVGRLPSSGRSAHLPFIGPAQAPDFHSRPP
jgi:hypothetical protein